MQIAILSGGLGTRIRPVTGNIPKGMVLVDGKPFFFHQLELLKKNNITDIVLCAGYLSEQIEGYFRDGSAFGVKISYSIEKGPLLGTAGALKNAEALLKEEFFVMYGDSYLELDYAAVEAAFRKSGKPAMMTVYRNENALDKSNVRVEGGLVVNYQKNSPEPMDSIDYGLSALKKSIISSLPAGANLGLEGVFSSLAARGELCAYKADREFHEIGSPDGLERFINYVKRKNNL